MATNMPPHNLGEVVDALVAMIDEPTIDVDRLTKHIKGPDFPTGAIILGREGIREAYRSGRGRIVDARAHPHRGAARRPHARSSSASCRTASRRAATRA